MIDKIYIRFCEKYNNINWVFKPHPLEIGMEALK